MDGVRPEVPKAHGSFEPRGSGSPSLKSCPWESIVLCMSSASFKLSFDLKRLWEFRRSQVCWVVVKICVTHLEWSPRSRASASVVAPDAAAVEATAPPVFAVCAWGKLSRNVLRNSSFGLCDDLLDDRYQPLLMRGQGSRCAQPSSRSVAHRECGWWETYLLRNMAVAAKAREGGWSLTNATEHERG